MERVLAASYILTLCARPYVAYTHTHTHSLCLVFLLDVSTCDPAMLLPNTIHTGRVILRTQPSKNNDEHFKVRMKIVRYFDVLLRVLLLFHSHLVLIPYTFRRN